MSDFTRRHVTATIPVQMPASTQADGDPGYTPADVINALQEQTWRTMRRLERDIIEQVLR